jgi:CRISPR/Cas system CMR-associated protein Cmr5 small subunit
MRKKKQVNKNDFLIVNPDTLHNEESKSKNFGVYIIGIENYLLENNSQDKNVTYHAEDDRICYYAEQIVKDYERESKTFYIMRQKLKNLLTQSKINA